MPAIAIWGIVLGAIALVIAFILSIRVKVIVSFKDGKLLAHKKILFLKKQVHPKLKKKKKRHPGILKETTDQIVESEDPRQIAKMIIALKEFIAKVLFDLLDKVNIRVVKIHASIGTSDAATTAIAHSLVVQCAAYLVDFLDNHSNIDLSGKADIDIRPDFLSQKSWAEINCVFHLRVITALFLRLETIITLLKIENIEEILSEVIKNGTIETK